MAGSTTPARSIRCARACRGRGSPSRARSSSSARPATWRIASWCRRCSSSREGGNLPAECAIVGFARRDWTDEELRDEFEKTLAKEAVPTSPRSGRSSPTASVFPGGRSTTRRPSEAQGEARTSSTGRTGPAGNRLYYLAVSPEFFATIIEQLGKAGLVYPAAGDALEPGGHREAVRPRPRIGPRLEPRRRPRARREPGVSNRPLSGQGDGPEHPAPCDSATAIFEPVWNRRHVARRCRSRWPRRSAWPAAGGRITTPRARSATWSRTT